MILACRDVAKGEEAVKDMATSVNVKKIKVMKIDLASLDSVRKFVEDFNESEYSCQQYLSLLRMMEVSFLYRIFIVWLVQSKN